MCSKPTLFQVVWLQAGRLAGPMGHGLTTCLIAGSSSGGENMANKLRKPYRNGKELWPNVPFIRVAM